MSSLKSVLQTVLLSLLLFPSVSWAAYESVGRVIVSRGEVVAEQLDGVVRVLKRRAKIFAGDTLVTGKNGRVQIRFSDKGLLELQANTRFLIETYHFDDDYNKRAASYSLLKGGMRTVTGLIGQTNKKNYKVETPVATIGLRGTHWGAHWCESECVSATGVKLEAGLYGGVVNGGVIVTNSGGQKSFSGDEYFFVANSNALPRALTKPPGVVFADGAPNKSAQSEDRDGGSERGEESREEESSDSSQDANSNDDSHSTERESDESSDFSEPSDDEVSDSAENQDNVVSTESVASAESSDNDNEVELPSASETSASTEIDDSASDDVMPESLQPPDESDDNDVRHDLEQNQPDVDEELNNSGASSTDDVELDDESDYLDNKVVDAPKSAGAVTVHRPQNQGASTSVLSVAKGDDLKVSNSGILEEADISATGFHLDRDGSTNSDASMMSVGGADVYWGRWQNGFKVEDDSNNLQESSGSMLYIYTPDMTPIETITSKTGVVQFNHVGGPAAVDELGGTGSMSGSSVTVNFGSQTVDSAHYQLNMDSGREYSAGLSTGSVSLSEAMAGNMSLSGTCSGVDCGAAGTAVTGTAGLGFVGNDAQGAISSIGLQDANGGRGVTAVGVFEAQP
ncbi:MAG: FecR domain-containing protein [Gammaproteobacteria bacterium]|nr:FecR domain-containing protein [Gammaproteobacteria bacterium]